MEITEVRAGKGRKINISIAQAEDFKLMTKKRFFFIWKSLKNSKTVYKLQLKGNDDILGAMAVVDWPGEKRIEIKLLATGIENMGKGKIYEGIAGCLIAYTCRLAVTAYGVEACVSLVPKTDLIAHYMQKYHMKDGGRQLYLDGKELLDLLNEYL